MRLALYQPDMPSNTGTMMRLCACLGVGLDIIEPCGFVLDDQKLRRAAMDYIDHLSMSRHRSWDEFRAQTGKSRLVLLTTKGALPYTHFSFKPDDILMVGRESAGVPDEVHESVEARILIPMKPPLRSLNVAISAAMALGEALRQCPNLISFTGNPKNLSSSHKRGFNEVGAHTRKSCAPRKIMVEIALKQIEKRVEKQKGSPNYFEIRANVFVDC